MARKKTSVLERIEQGKTGFADAFADLGGETQLRAFDLAVAVPGVGEKRATRAFRRAGVATWLLAREASAEQIDRLEAEL